MEEMKTIFLAFYLFTFTLPFFIAYAMIWFANVFTRLFRLRNAKAPRWFRWSYSGLIWSVSACCVVSSFFSGFHTAAEYLHKYLSLQ